jgi:PIN domain nuclease of toxin-antitoxin system
MKLLLDTHVLLWAAGKPEKLSRKARRLLEEPENTLVFSPVSLWEIAIKHTLGRDDFRADIRLLRRGLRDAGYEELPLTSDHAVGLGSLPPLHKDPFDRNFACTEPGRGHDADHRGRGGREISGAVQKV